MYSGRSVAAVIPCYNEGTQIRSVVEGLPDFVDHVICIDDASTDDTPVRLAEMEAEHPGRLTILRHDRNLGVGRTRVDGYILARDEGWDIVAALDGDGQMDPADLEALVAPVANDECDFCKGNRLASGEAWRMMPKVRYLGNSFLSLLTKMVSGYWHIVDSQTGYAVINHKALAALEIEKAYHTYGFPNDLLILLNVVNARVRDVPVRPIYGVGERSSMKLWKVIPAISWLLFRRFFWRLGTKYVIRDFHPLVFFYFFGALLQAVGLVLGVRELVVHIAAGSALPVPTMVLVALLLISGLQLSLWAMWFDQDYNKDLR